MSGDDADDENEGEQVMAQADQSIVVQEYDWKKIVVELKLRTITDSTSRQAKKSGSKNQQQNNGKPQQQNNGKQSQSFKQKAPVTSEKTKIAQLKTSELQLAVAIKEVKEKRSTVFKSSNTC